MDTLGNRDILFVFPPVMSNPKTRLILKTPKTATSVRRVWLPKTLAYILREWRDTQQKQKEFLGDEYFDYDLVVAHYNGRPCDCKNIEKKLQPTEGGRRATKRGVPFAPSFKHNLQAEA